MIVLVGDDDAVAVVDLMLRDQEDLGTVLRFMLLREDPCALQVIDVPLEGCGIAQIVWPNDCDVSVEQVQAILGRVNPDHLRAGIRTTENTKLAAMVSPGNGTGAMVPRALVLIPPHLLTRGAT